MNNKNFTLSFALLLLSFTTTFAANYTVTFGSFFYSPDTLLVNVGDQVTWSGSFTSHPLVSTSVPSGAASFSNSTGTTYSYTVTMPGTYNYECSIHGFKGVLIASPISGINEPGLTAEIKVYPNPAPSFVTIAIDESLVGSTATITDVTGRRVAAVQLETRNQKLETADCAPGIYFITLTGTGGGIATKKLILNK